MGEVSHSYLFSKLASARRRLELKHCSGGLFLYITSVDLIRLIIGTNTASQPIARSRQGFVK
ncbi:hypothetical protein BDW72DRAFT_181141 [Aspergillus terricola var. indicus]